jgi:hypothetical protein
MTSRYSMTLNEPFVAHSVPNLSKLFKYTKSLIVEYSAK